MPEITRRSFMALLAAAGVAGGHVVELPEAPESGPFPPEPPAPSNAKFTWTPDGGKQIPLQVMAVSQYVHTETIMDDDHGGILRRQPLRSGAIDVETPHFWDCHMMQRGTLRFTVDGQAISVEADVCGCERELNHHRGYLQRTTLIYHELTVEEA